MIVKITRMSVNITRVIVQITIRVPKSQLYRAKITQTHDVKTTLVRVI
jgi:hypothetical protein